MWIEVFDLEESVENFLKGLPDGEFEIYRGGYDWGLSWTLDKSVAEWFLERKTH
jgi:hypothetical protein